MKCILVFEDTVTVNGPGVDIKLMTDPPIKPGEKTLSQAHQLAMLALNTVGAVLEISGQLAEAQVAIAKVRDN